MAWIDAEKHCWRYNANLASLHDQAEYDFIQQTVMAPSRCGNVRIGGYAVRINDWLWSDGSEFWDFGFLDRSRWRRCLTVNCNGMRGWYCEDRRPVICATAVDGQF
ncbi:ladderlectin-like [Aulostomus maculatus]